MEPVKLNLPIKESKKLQDSKITTNIYSIQQNLTRRVKQVMVQRLCAIHSAILCVVIVLAFFQGVDVKPFTH